MRPLAQTDPEVAAAITAELAGQQSTLKMIASKNFAPLAVMHAHDRRPKMIVAGWSAYPRHLDFAEFRRIADEVDGYLRGGHGARRRPGGRRAAPIAGPARTRGDLHHAQDARRPPRRSNPGDRRPAQEAELIGVPGQQCGPLEHVIAAKAVAFKLAAEPAFRERQKRTLAGARLVAQRPLEPDCQEAGVNVVSGGTDVHLVLVDLRESPLDGRQAEDRLHSIGITVNQNAVPFDPRPPMVSSGVRIGTPALAARGFGAADFTEVAGIIATALRPALGEDRLARLRQRVTTLADRHPLYAELAGGLR